MTTASMRSNNDPSNDPEVHALLNGSRTPAEVYAYFSRIAPTPSTVMQAERVFAALDLQRSPDWERSLYLETVSDRIFSSVSELDDMLKHCDRAYVSYLIVTNHVDALTIEIGWKDQMVGAVTWDRWTDEGGEAVALYVAVASFCDNAYYRYETRPSPKGAGPLYRYHPERFKAVRGYAPTVAQFYRRLVDPSSGMLTLDLMNDLLVNVMTDLNARSMSFPRRLKDDLPNPSLIVDAEISLATAYGRFVQAGRQIMDFPPALTEMLGKTDIDDIPLNSLMLPFAAQYLYFGPQTDLEIEPGWLVDGAYVEQRGERGDLRFTITAVPTDPTLIDQWYVRPEPEYTQDFVEDFRSMDVATAIDMVLSDRLAPLREMKTKGGDDLTQALRAELANRGAELPASHQVKNISPSMAQIRELQTMHRHPIYKSAMQLIVNALCYLTAYPDDMATAWPDGTPLKLKNKADHSSGKEAQRAKSKLASLGYVPIHLCGQRAAEQRQAAMNSAPLQAGHVSVHWRRGHWRNQAHGPQRALRKLIWLMPVLVGSSTGDSPDTGHLYLVS